MPGATLAVGQAANTTGASVGGAQTLSISSLAVSSTAGGATPALTFNLFGDGISDALNLTGTGNTLTFSGAGVFNIGFASGSGDALGSGTYTLITFATPQSTGNAPLLSSFQAVGAGNAGVLNTPMNPFAYLTNVNGQITGLTVTVNGTVAVPEPSTLWFVSGGLVFVVLLLRRRYLGRA